MIEDVRSRFASEMNIKIAMEADFIPGSKPRLKQ